MIKVLNVKSLYSALYQAVEFCTNNKDEEIEIVVPDKLSLFMEKFLFEHMSINSSFSIKVSTLNRFAKKSCVVEKEKQISKIGSILLIHKILNNNIDKLSVLKSKAYSFNYAEEIFRTVGQLKASKISFEEMKLFTSSDSQLCGKIKDLALVYEEYEKAKAGLLDASDLFLMSSLFVANGKENKKLLFVGFDDFTAIEYAVIERLAMVAEVNIVHYNSKKSNKHIYNNEVVSQLKDIAYINQLPFEIQDYNETNLPLKQFLENNLYSLEKEEFVLEDELVKIYAGNSSEDEIEFVARDIRTKILNGHRFDDFGVAVFGLQNSLSKLKEIFEKYEINYYLDTEMALNKSILYNFFSSVLKYNVDGYSLSSLIDIINSPFFQLDDDKKRDIIQKLISVKFRGKISSNLNIDIDNETKSTLVGFIGNVIFERNATVAEVVAKLKALNIDLDLILNNIAVNDLESKLLITKSKDAIFSLFDEILKFNADIDLNAFFDIFTHITSVVKISNLPLKIDAVKVVDANNTMEVFNEFYVVRANQESAPNLKFDCGIILDKEIEQLNFSHKLSPTISHINRLARLRLYNLMMLFEKELIITYSKTPCDIVKELLEKLKVETKLGLVNLVPFSKFGYEKYSILSKWDYIDKFCKQEKNNKNLLNIEEKLIGNKDFLNISKNNLNIFNGINEISATTLENYFKCPMSAVLSNILKIKPRLEVDILSLDIGNILHDITYTYYKRNKNVGDIYEFCKNEIFKCVEKEERLKLNIDSPIIVNLIDEAVRVINAVNYIDSNSNFAPKFFEFDFRGNNALKLKNISIIGKVDRVDIFNDMFRVVDYKSGKADASLKELYYGNKLQLFLYSCAMERVLNKHSVGAFYLPLHNAYTKELGNTYSLKGFYIAEDFVVKAFDKRLQPCAKSDIVNVTLTKTGDVRKSIGYKELESREMDNLKSYAIKASENAVEEIKSGFIAPSPSDVSKPCEYCPYVHICLKSCNDITYRKAGKINLDSFKETDND